MKNFFTLFLSISALLFCSSCATNIKEPLDVHTENEVNATKSIEVGSITPQSLTIPYRGGEFQIDINTEEDWYFGYLPEEITPVSHSGHTPFTDDNELGIWALPGKGTETITLIFDYNEFDRPREYTAFVQFLDVVLATPSFLAPYQIIQDPNPAPRNSLTPAVYYIDNARQTLTFSVNTKYSWAFDTEHGPFTADVSSGTGETIINITVEENQGIGRVIEIPVIFMEDLQHLGVFLAKVYQGNNRVLPENQSIGAEGGEFEIRIESDFDWLITPYHNNIRYGATAGIGNKAVTLYIDSDFSGIERTYDIPVTFHPDMGADIRTVFITQTTDITQDDNTIIPFNKNVPATGGDYQFRIQSPFTWTLVNPSPEYLTFSQTTGTGNAIINVSVKKNEAAVPITSQVRVAFNDPSKFFPIVGTTTIVQERAE